MKCLVLVITMLLLTTPLASAAGPFDHCASDDAKCVGEVLLRELRLAGNPGDRCAIGMSGVRNRCFGLGATGESCSAYCRSKQLTAVWEKLDKDGCEYVARAIGLSFDGVEQGTACGVYNGRLFHNYDASPETSTLGRRVCECQ